MFGRKKITSKECWKSGHWERKFKESGQLMAWCSLEEAASLSRTDLIRKGRHLTYLSGSFKYASEQQKEGFKFDVFKTEMGTCQFQRNIIQSFLQAFLFSVTWELKQLAQCVCFPQGRTRVRRVLSSLQVQPGMVMHGSSHSPWEDMSSRLAWAN